MCPETHTFWDLYTLSIVADDVWLSVRLRDRQGKHRGNKYCTGTVIAEVQRDALPWTDVMLSTSYNKCHEWTSGWISPMTKCTGRIKYAFPDPCVMVFFFLLVLLCTNTCHNIGHSFLATINKCTELGKYAFPDPCLLHFFSLVL